MQECPYKIARLRQQLSGFEFVFRMQHVRAKMCLLRAEEKRVGKKSTFVGDRLTPVIRRYLFFRTAESLEPPITTDRNISFEYGVFKTSFRHTAMV